ncbi:MAG: bifunctional glutamate N-acetyltransferase/amino-acid acetyltransferase ArgJ [Pseudomonadales bacterium]|jgi:glutamate N-acetyltransferase/amino-acid N-acetyltransferase|nr:bifunctional glutamate N-acetyltransferase/amino-acid acetyltransferase ArgJ [Pseudomonadales bacterium]
MAVGSGDYGTLYAVPGVRLAAVSAGIKKAGRLDLVLFELSEGSVTAGVFTTNAFCAAPVVLSKRHLAARMPRYFLINTGNANAGTGTPGLDAALRCCQSLATLSQSDETAVLPFSTGVIGEALPAEKITAALPGALRDLAPTHWELAARGIMTTDTRPKAASRQLTLGGKTLTITGIAKGAGMIKPNMATMLGFVCTDLALRQEEAQALLRASADKSFNRITVDGDTSTNDCCMLAATGTSGVRFSALTADERAQFAAALHEVCVALATAIIKDGEGATKFVTVDIEGGADTAECLQVGYAIAESPLVKTALFASDPNWGRILAAVGRAGLHALDLDAIGIWLDEVKIVERGARAASYTEEQGQRVLKQEAFTIRVALGRGAAVERLWTCDFSHDYVSINADYRS